jgi:hypothetical protein
MSEELIIKHLGNCEVCFCKPATFLVIYRHVGFLRHFNMARLMCDDCTKNWKMTTKFPTLHDWSAITVNC